MAKAREICAICEQEGEELPDAALPLVCLGRELADKLHGQLEVVLLGPEVTKVVDTLDCYGADTICITSDLPAQSYAAELYATIVSEYLRQQSHRIILCSVTSLGQHLAARLSARLKIGLITNCTSINMDRPGVVHFAKLAYDGNLTIEGTCETPVVATMEADLINPRPVRKTHGAEITKFNPQLPETLCKVVGFRSLDSRSLSVEEADVLIAGGKGIGSQDNVRLLEELAELLGGAVAASRAAVDAGWISQERQIGQTGKIVCPRLYIGCGISGQTYHTIGVRGSKLIIAINKDRNAPFFKIADIGAVGDFREITTSLIAQLRGMLEAAK